MNEFENYIDKGGIIFIILLIMSAIGLTIIIYKFFELYLFGKNGLKKFDQSLNNCSTISEFNQNLEDLTKSNFFKSDPRNTF